MKDEILKKVRKNIDKKVDGWVEIVFDHILGNASTDFAFEVFANKKTGDVHIHYGYGNIGIPTYFYDDEDIILFLYITFHVFGDPVEERDEYEGTDDDYENYISEVKAGIKEKFYQQA